MNRKITTLLVTIARHFLIMAHRLGNQRGLPAASRTENSIAMDHKMNRRLTTIAIDILLMAHGIEDP